MVVGSGNPKNTDKSVIARAGVTKVFVGELVEEARRVAEAAGAKGALQPAHIHAAYQRLQEQDKVEGLGPAKRRVLL